MYKAIISIILLMIYSSGLFADQINGYQRKACERNIFCMTVSAERADVGRSDGLTHLSNMKLEVFNKMGDRVSLQNAEFAIIDDEMGLLLFDSPKDGNAIAFDLRTFRLKKF